MKAVSKTAYYCAGVRMADAESDNPLIGDPYARRLIGEEGLQYFQDFIHLERPNTGNVIRHYIIDREIQSELKKHPDLTIILIGAGLDSRAFRFSTGKWVEIDEAGMIEYKNGKLPVGECPNPLERIPIQFEKNELEEKLSPYTGRPHVLFIIEGVFMYLGREQKDRLLDTLTNLFPGHILICDLMKKKFFDKYARPIHEKLVEHGTHFEDLMEDPQQLFLQHGYEREGVYSILYTGVELRRVPMPKWMADLFFKKMFMGYSIYKFKAAQTSANS